MSNEDVLKHRTRKQIFRYIDINPGISFSKIQDFFDIKTSTLQYHLNYLERNKIIASNKEGKRRCFYCIDSQESHSLRAELDSLTKVQSRIIEIIRKNPGISQKKIIKQTKKNQKTVSYNLIRLMELKLIWKVKNDDKVGYEYISKETFRSELINQLLLKLLNDEIDQETFLLMKNKIDSLLEE